MKQTKTNLKATVRIKSLKWSLGISLTKLIFYDFELMLFVEFKLRNSHPPGFSVKMFFFIPLTEFNSDKSKVCPESRSI